jgi:hypothetical protein
LAFAKKRKPLQQEAALPIRIDLLFNHDLFGKWLVINKEIHNINT